jgi:amino acid transporter
MKNFLGLEKENSEYNGSKYVIVPLPLEFSTSYGKGTQDGPQAIIDNKEVALSVAGQKALGTSGLILATTAAMFSTASAINATLFATARLARKVSEEGELPASLKKRDKRGLPRRSIILIGAGGAILSVSGSLSGLVESASLVFLFLFAVVNLLALKESKKRRLISLLGVIGATSAALVLMWRFLTTAPELLGVLSLMILGTVLGRRFVRKEAEEIDEIVEEIEEELHI